MTIKELIHQLEGFDENLIVRYAVFVDDGIIGSTNEVDTIGDYSDENKPYILLF